jgi:hypothetical protein
MRNSQYLPPFPLGALRSPDEPIGQSTSPMTDVRFGHDFSRIRVWPKNETPDSLTTVNSLTVGKKLSTQPYSTNQSQSNGPTVHAISASGTGTVYTSYTPEAADKSTKIVFIQVMRELLDGVPVKPSVTSPYFSYQDADTTSDFQHVDYVRGEKDPYYNGDDPRDIGTQGNAISKPRLPLPPGTPRSTTMGHFRWEKRSCFMNSEQPLLAPPARTREPITRIPTGPIGNSRVARVAPHLWGLTRAIQVQSLLTPLNYGTPSMVSRCRLKEGVSLSVAWLAREWVPPQAPGLDLRSEDLLARQSVAC